MHMRTPYDFEKKYFKDVYSKTPLEKMRCGEFENAYLNSESILEIFAKNL